MSYRKYYCEPISCKREYCYISRIEM